MSRKSSAGKKPLKVVDRTASSEQRFLQEIMRKMQSPDRNRTESRLKAKMKQVSQKLRLKRGSIRPKKLSTGEVNSAPTGINLTQPSPAQIQAWSESSREANVEVFKVLYDLALDKRMREKDQIAADLVAVQGRVKEVLDRIGMGNDDAGSFKHGAYPPVFDTKMEREKMQARGRLTDKMYAFVVKCMVKEEYLVELEVWHKQKFNMCSDVMTDDDMDFICDECVEINKEVKSALNFFTKTGERVVTLGRELCTVSMKYYKERKAQMRIKSKKEKMSVYDEKALSDPNRWEAAAKNIIGVFEESQKIVKNIVSKNALRLGQKQYENQMCFVESRNKELDEKKKTCQELQSKLKTAKEQGDQLVQEIVELKRRSSKMFLDLSEAKNLMESLEDHNKVLTKTVAEMEYKVRILEEDLSEKTKQPQPPPTPSVPTPPPPTALREKEKEIVTLKVADSATDQRLKQMETQLQAAKDQIATFVERIADLEKQLKTEKDRNNALSASFKPAPLPKSTLKESMKEQIPEPSDKDKDSTYYKTLMNGMRNEFHLEIERLKSFVKRERQRSEANVRRIETTQKEQLNAIQKDTIRMLRAIVHFRDLMITVVEKEGLPDIATELAAIGHLDEKLSPDPKEAMAVVLTTVVEYLNSLETILCKAFMSMKILMRFQMEKQVERQVEQELMLRQKKREMEKENRAIIRSVGKKQKAIEGAKTEVAGMANRLKKTKNKMVTYGGVMGGDTKLRDRRYNDLMERYNNVWKLYQNLQGQMESIQVDFKETMDRKLEEKEELMMTSFRIDNQRAKQERIESLKVAIDTQKENLVRINKAYEENKLSKDLHQMAVSLLHRTMEIPCFKLKRLFEQYISFRTVQDAKARVAKVMVEEDLPDQVICDVESYVMDLDRKHMAAMSEWRQQKMVIEREQKDLNAQIYRVFNEVLLDSGIMLDHPLLKESERNNLMVKNVASLKNVSGGGQMRKKIKAMNSLLKMPAMLTGKAMTTDQADTSVWAPDQTPTRGGLTAGITEPHMMGYDVNRPRIRSLRFLKPKPPQMCPVPKSEIVGL